MNFGLSQKIKQIIFVLSGLLLVSNITLAQVIEPEAVPGEYLVKIKSTLKSTTLNSTTLNSNSAARLFYNPALLSHQLQAQVLRILPDANMVVVQRPPIETQSSSVTLMAQNDFVEYVEPNYIYRALALPNDTSFGKQWGLKSSLSNGIDIGAEAAWDVTTGSEQIIVGIIDSGVDLSHPELKGNLWVNQAEANGQPGVDDDGNGYVDDINGFNAINPRSSPNDESGHGTHCAGTIGATGNDGVGITGVNWKVKIMPLRFLGSDGVGTLEAAIRAIDYGIKMGARILSNSWGAYTSSQGLQEAIERSNQAGILFVAAAGNDGTNNDIKPMFPASHPIANVISVAASNERGVMAPFSNWGKTTVHIGAPGAAILGLWKNGETASKSGTSMAAPFVSGVAALILSHEPHLTHLELKERILKTARPLGDFRNRTVTGGLVNAYYGINNLIAPPDENDPANWKSIPINISSEHPYKPQTKQVFEVNIPGAKQIALYFERFEVEFQNDQLVFRDKNDKTSVFTGNRNERYSRPINGDTVKLEFKSDVATEGYGFDIVKAAYR